MRILTDTTIAVLRGEPGADVVRQRIVGSIISAVNYSEVLKKTIEVDGLPEAVDAHMGALCVTVIPFDDQQARAAASLYPITKSNGLSFADRACLCLGISRDASVLTSEKRMADAQVPIKVKLIRGKQ